MPTWSRICLQWAMLLVLSAAFVAVLEAVHLPAALLLGPLAAAVVVSTTAGTLSVPIPPFYAAQAVVGCMIARSIPASIVGELLHHWPLFLAGVASVIAASTLLGWLLARRQVLPGTTAIWGSSPGAATAMVLMSSAYGADARLVAFMQYLRVVCVAAVASLVARLWGLAPGAAPVAWFPAIAWLPFAETLGLAAAGAIVGRLLRVPAGQLLLPMAFGIVLQGAGWLTVTLPPWLLAASYAVVGWSIGARFTRPILGHVARALPRVLASTLVLIALCGVLAALLVVLAGIDPLTAYLATSPGGADSVAIIAASSNVDVPFVMAMQTARFMLLLAVGPALARFVAQHAVSLPTKT
jgi:hypothetical protein